MNYTEISKDTIDLIHKSYASLNDSPLNQGLRAMIELRVSQLNGCAYCCGLHLTEARKQKISQKKLDVIAAWQTANIFSDQEMAALGWAESVTLLDENSVVLKDDLSKHFSTREIVDLTACVSLMNTLNRLAICLTD